jgi:aminoglycoside phosphotransferase (APT) family kinase protein
VTADRRERLGPWLTARLGTRLGATGPVRVVGESGPASTGYSAETAIVDVAYDAVAGPAERRLVLRVETPDPPIYPAQVAGVAVEIDIQRRVMQAVAPAIPVAEVFAAEDDPAVIGAPFFVMDFVEGVVPAIDPPYTVVGFFADASPEERTRLVADGLRVLAALHALDWRAAGLSWLVPTGVTPSLARQLDVWEAYAARELGARRHPGLDDAFAVLRRHLRLCHRFRSRRDRAAGARSRLVVDVRPDLP